MKLAHPLFASAFAIIASATSLAQEPPAPADAPTPAETPATEVTPTPETATTATPAETIAPTAPTAATPPSTSTPEASNATQPTKRAGPAADAYVVSDVLFWAMAGAFTFHITDHALRNNHSGFPLTNEINPFLAFITVFPTLMAAGAILDLGPLYWIVADSVMLAAIVAAHTIVEPPADQYLPWENGTNLLGIEAPAVGVITVIVGQLSASVFAGHLVSSIHDGTRYGFTWTRVRGETE